MRPSDTLTPPAAPSVAARLVPRPTFRPDIEGLRAIAVLLVVLYHAGIAGFGGGYIGVDVFFVLSGYLITWLLVHEAEDTGTVRLRRFYARRARRLLPAMALVVVATAVAGAVIYAPFEQRLLANSAIATAAYASNVYFASIATDYLGAAAETNPFLHTWSLSVEEQFYLVWPVFVMFALGVLRWQRGAGGRRRIVGWLTAVAVVSFAASTYLTGTAQPLAFFLSPLRAWEFAAGALAVLVPPRPNAQPVDPNRRLNPWPVGGIAHALGWVGLGGMLVAGMTFDRATPFPGWAALLPVVATVLVVRAGTSEAQTALARLLALRPLQELGRLSYSWYLWHWPVLVYADALGIAESLPARLAGLLLSLALAEASYRWVEDPVRRHSALVGRPGRSFGVAVALTLLVIALGAGWRLTAQGWASAPGQSFYTSAERDVPALYEDECMAEYEDVDVVECVYGVPDADTTVVLFGDSHAAQWFPALLGVAQQRGWRLVPVIKTACPSADVSFHYAALGRRYTECETWRETALDAIDQVGPYVVVVASSIAYAVSPAEWAAGTTVTLARLQNAAGHVVAFQDTPRPGFGVPECLARGAWRSSWRGEGGCDFASAVPARDAVFHLEEEATGTLGIPYVRWSKTLCGGSRCEPVSDGRIVYRDSNHLTASFVEALTPLVDRSLREAGV